MSQPIGKQDACPQPALIRQKILVLGTGPVFSEDVIDYATNLAGRLSYDLVVMLVDTQWEGRSFNKKAGASTRKWQLKAATEGIDCSFVIKKGDPAQAVEELNRQEKRIEFVIADDQLDRKIMDGQIALPIFSVISNRLEKDGGKAMAGKRLNGKKRLMVSTIGFGCLSAALYGAFFMNMNTVMEYCTRGGAYAALPILTALAFSFSHSAFASKTYSLLGIEAAKKNVLQQVEQKVIEKKKQARKKPRKYSYVNPFHRI